VDDCGPFVVASRSRHVRAIRFFLPLVFVGALTGCYSPGPREVISTVAPSLTELKDSTVQIRQLTLDHDIALLGNGSATPASEPNGLVPGAYRPFSVQQVERAYKRIGLLDENADYARSLADYERLERMAFYDGNRRSLVLSPEAFRVGLVFAQANPRMAREIPALFGIVHAMQAQHFHWDEKLRFISLEDRRLAFRSLAQGDAALVALAHSIGEKKVPTSAVDIQIIARLGAALEKLAVELPPLLRHKLVFPFREGSQFVLWAYAAKGWQGVNRLYADPPLSSAQILHPERYYRQRENPIRIFPWGLAARLKENVLLEQTLGESLVRLLIASVRSSQESAEIVAAWQGDQLSAYPLGEHFVTAWMSSWRNDQSARSFFRAYEEALAKRHRVRLEPSPHEKDRRQADLPGGRALVLQVKGPLVLFLDGLPAAQIPEIADAAWKDLETDREPWQAPLDLGGWPLQLSRTRK